MSRLTLTFDMNEPEDKHNARLAMAAQDLALALYALSEKFRSIERYEELDPDAYEMICRVRKLYCEATEGLGEFIYS